MIKEENQNRVNYDIEQPKKSQRVSRYCLSQLQNRQTRPRVLSDQVSYHCGKFGRVKNITFV